MRIGIDARELCGRPTGVGRYLSGLLEEWRRSDRAQLHQFILYAPENLSIPALTGPDGGISSATLPASGAASAPRFASRIVPGSGGSWWEQIPLASALARDQLDVFFAPGYTAPLWLSVPLVVAIHDVSFAAHPEWFTTREGLRRRFLSRRAAAAASAVITISEFSRGELIEQLGADPGRIHVIPPGIDGVIGGVRDSDAPQISADLKVRPTSGQGAGPSGQPGGRPCPEARVLYVGSIFNRRHIPDLLRAFAIVARTHPEATLDLVGDNRTYPPQNIEAAIDREGMGDRVRWRRYVTDADLIALYRGARAFAFLSEYEGLGLTPLEALAAGIPPVLLETPVARESCGAAALYAQAGDVRGIAAALEQLLFDEQVRSRLLAAAPAVLARYDWTAAAARTLAVLEQAATSKGRSGSTGPGAA